MALAGLGLGATISFALVAERLTDLGTSSGQLVAAGRLTGMVGTYALLLSVLLVGRLPWIEREIGLDRLVRWHRTLAPWSLVLLVAHAVLLTLGIAAVAHTGVLRELWTMVTTMTGMLAATVGLIMLIAAAITSIRIARRHMKYETWWVVHLYSYLALAFSWSHQLATGAPFADQPLARIFWTALWIGTAGLVFAYRVLLPAWRSLRHGLRVESVVEEAPGVVSLICRGRDLHRLPISGGQFLQWRFLTREMWWQAHPYSLSALPKSNRMRVTVKNLGDHSRSLARLRPGTRIAIEGPYGAFTQAARVRQHVLLIGAGVGATPLCAMLDDLDQDAHVVVILRASTADELVLAEEIDTLVQARGGHVYRLVGSRRKWPLDHHQLARLVPDIRSRDLFVCGPEAFMGSVTASARSLGVAPAQLHREEYTFG